MHVYDKVYLHPLPAEFALQGPRLPFGIATDGRAAADGRIVMLHLAGPSRRDQFGQRLPSDTGKREVNNVGVAKEVVKKWFDRFQRVGSTELKENYPHTPCCARHFPQNPQNGRHFTPNQVCESMPE